MKRMYLLLLWLLPFIMLPIYSQAISQFELRGSSRYVQFESVADYKVYYVDMESITPITAPEGHRRITATVYALVDGEDYIVAVQMEYDYQLDRSLRQLLSKHDVLKSQGQDSPYISVWRDKQDNIGITCRILGVKEYTLSGNSMAELYKIDNVYKDISELSFKGNRYKMLNAIYKQAYGIYFDDEMSSKLL